MLRREARGFSFLRVACDLPTMGVVLETLCVLFGSASLGGGGGWRLGFETCLFEFMGDGVGFCSSSLSCCSRALYLK